MNNSEMPVAEIMTIQLLQGSQMDRSDQMRIQMFCMDIEKVSKDLDIELPEEIFIDQFVSEIIETSGYKGFISFCEVNMDGMRYLGQQVYELLM